MLVDRLATLLSIQHTVARDVSLLTKRSLVARVDLVHIDVGRGVQLIVTDIAVRSG